MSTVLIIDRFEGAWAIIEYEDQTFNLPRALLPENTKEGDVIQLTITIDPKATADKKKKAESLLENFFDE